MDDWVEYIDSTSGAPFYVNKTTGDKSWYRPQGSDSNGDGAAWIECIDEASGFFYYMNTQTYESVWDPPEGFTSEKNVSAKARRSRALTNTVTIDQLMGDKIAQQLAAESSLDTISEATEPVVVEPVEEVKAASVTADSPLLEIPELPEQPASNSAAPPSLGRKTSRPLPLPPVTAVVEPAKNPPPERPQRSSMISSTPPPRRPSRALPAPPVASVDTPPPLPPPVLPKRVSMSMKVDKKKRNPPPRTATPASTTSSDAVAEDDTAIRTRARSKSAQRGWDSIKKVVVPKPVPGKKKVSVLSRLPPGFALPGMGMTREPSPSFVKKISMPSSSQESSASSISSSGAATAGKPKLPQRGFSYFGGGSAAQPKSLLKAAPSKTEPTPVQARPKPRPAPKFPIPARKKKVGFQLGFSDPAPPAPAATSHTRQWSGGKRKTMPPMMPGRGKNLLGRKKPSKPKRMSVRPPPLPASHLKKVAAKQNIVKRAKPLAKAPAPPSRPNAFLKFLPTDFKVAVADEKKAQPDIDLVGVFLEDIQPHVRRGQKATIEIFETTYFSANFYLSPERIKNLLHGESRPDGSMSTGLMAVCGQHSRTKTHLLKRSAANALKLLARLCDASNVSSRRFVSTLVTAKHSDLDSLCLPQHDLAKDLDRGAKAAAAKIRELLKNSESTWVETSAPPIPVRTSVISRPPPDVPTTQTKKPVAAPSRPAPAPVRSKQKATPPPIRPAVSLERKLSNRNNSNNNSNNNVNSSFSFSKMWEALRSLFKGNARKTRGQVQKMGILKEEKMFGRPLEAVAMEYGSQGVPDIVRALCQHLTKFHLEEPGLFRVSGGHGEIQNMKRHCDYEGKLPVLEGQNPHAVAGLLKLYFRELPDCLLTCSAYEKLVDAVKEQEEKKITDVMAHLPDASRATLDFLLDFLMDVQAHSSVNKMACKNLAIVFAPTLLRREKPSLSDMQDTLHVVGVVSFLLASHPKQIASARDEPEATSAPAAVSAPKHSRTTSAAPPHPLIPQSVIEPPPTLSSVAPPPRVAPPPPTRKDSVRINPGWRQYSDPTTGKPYFYNTITKESSWKNPY
jgi:hypothetical protein